MTVTNSGSELLELWLGTLWAGLLAPARRHRRGDVLRPLGRPALRNCTRTRPHHDLGPRLSSPPSPTAAAMRSRRLSTTSRQIHKLRPTTTFTRRAGRSLDIGRRHRSTGPTHFRPRRPLKARTRSLTPNTSTRRTSSTTATRDLNLRRRLPLQPSHLRSPSSRRRTAGLHSHTSQVLPDVF